MNSNTSLLSGSTPKSTHPTSTQISVLWRDAETKNADRLSSCRKNSYRLKGAGHDARAYVTNEADRDWLVARAVQHEELWEKHYRAAYGRKTYTKHIVFPLAELAFLVEAGELRWSQIVPFNGANGGNDWLAKLSWIGADGRRYTANTGSITGSSPTMAAILGSE